MDDKDDKDDNVIDLDAEGTPVSRGMSRRQKRRAARTGNGEVKTTSRLFWIVLGGISTVVLFRVADAYFPRKPIVVGALPPGTAPAVAATEIEIL